MVELVDSVDLGSTARACRFESCCPHQEKGDRKVSLFLVRATGLEEGGTANGGAKNMPATCFLARGRVHETLTAASRAVGSVSYGSQPTSGNIVISVSTGENANRVLLPAPYRVFITDLSYEHSIFLLQSIFVIY